MGLAAMASDDANDPSYPTDPSRNCEKCRAVMKQLAVLPALSIHTAIKIFRCYACDHVVTEQG